MLLWHSNDEILFALNELEATQEIGIAGVTQLEVAVAWTDGL